MSTNILFLTPYEPTPSGNGGNHRAYQIQCDLEAVTGAVVQTLNLNLLHQRASPAPRRGWRDRIRLRTRLQDFLSGLVDRLAPKLFSGRLTGLWLSLRRELEGPRAPYLWHFRLSPTVMARVTELLDQGTVRLVVIEHSSWRPIQEACKSRNIPIVCCPQNLESLTYYRARPLESRITTLLHKFQGELQFFHDCDHVLFISRVEAGFALGMQCPGAAHYPYAPTGALRAHLEEVRRARLQRPQEPGLCLLVGTYSHAPIADGMLWLLEQIATHGLPKGIRLVVVGKDSEKLAAKLPPLEQVSFRGWVDEAELHELQQTVQCVLVPMVYGFGAQTRLAEMPVCGIPVIASRGAALAAEPHPLVTPVENRWEEWVQAMQQRTSQSGDPPEANNQLQALARRYLNPQPEFSSKSTKSLRTRA